MSKKSDENPVKELVENMGNSVSEKLKKQGFTINRGFGGESPEKEIKPPFEVMEDKKPMGVYEIVPGMTIEEMGAMFFNVVALIEPPYKIWQLNSKGHRYYYRYDDNGNPEFFPSVTTILSQTLPRSPFLNEWIARKGIEEAERYKSERAAYGTFMHSAFEELLINRSYDLDSLKGKLKTYIEVNRLPDDFIYYADELKKDVLAFAQFVLDYDVQPLAVEIALVHPHYKYAGMIDCPCTMLERIGGTERITAIVDFKSGRKGFYEEAEIQLHMYRDLWNVNFEKHPITKLFNFSPKDWRKRPTYNLKDQTDSPNAKKIMALLEIAAIEDAKKDNIFTSVSGEIMLDESPDLMKNVISLTLSELVKTKSPKELTPDGKTSVAVEGIKADAEIGNSTTKKNSIVRRVVKASKDVEKKAPASSSSKNKGITSKDSKESKKGLKKPVVESRKKMLSDEPEI